MFEILDKVCTPTKGTEFSACVDLYAREDVVIGAGETVLVPLGVKIDFENVHFQSRLALEYNKQEAFDNFKNFRRFFMKSHQLNLHIRSSMSAKHGLVIANGTGVIDLDYPGEIMICLHNPTTESTITWWIDRLANIVGFKTSWCGDNTVNYQIKKGDKIAQISLVEHKTYLLGVESEEKRTGGFGSTNK